MSRDNSQLKVSDVVVDTVLSVPSTPSAEPECHATIPSSFSEVEEEEKKKPEEQKCYNFLLVNYLLHLCGQLGEDQMTELNNLDIDWIKHVEKQEGLGQMGDVKMPLVMAYEFAKFRFAEDYPSDLKLFEDMTGLKPVGGKSPPKAKKRSTPY